MAFEKPPRIERTATAGVVLTREELSQLITMDLRDRKEYGPALEEEIEGLASTAQDLGRLACMDECGMVCSGVSLLDTTTKEHYDADITARCAKPDCTDQGITEAYVFLTALPAMSRSSFLNPQND